MKKNWLCFDRRKFPFWSGKTFKIMKISVFLFIAGVIGMYASNSYSQTTLLSLDLRETTVGEVLTNIEDQSEFVFLYSNKLVDVNRKVNLRAKNKPVSNILDHLFADTDVRYVVFDRQIILSPEEMLKKTIEQQNAPPQEIVVTGKVTDEDGNTLPGVNIVIKGTITGTISDADGNYRIDVEDTDATLVFSFMGYHSQEISLSGKTTINVTMAEKAIRLDEVVAIGYGTQRKKDITSAISNIKMENVEKRSMVNLSQAIQGKAAGVRVIQASGKPQGDFTIQVRGATSITAGNEPLYVVDGIPTSSISDINPADIQSMQILKDAASCAIYGARAANGVVLITTKIGTKSAKPLVSFRSAYSISQAANMLDILDAKQCAQLLNDEKINAGMAAIINPDTITTNIDWQDEIFFKGRTSDNQLSFSGGSEKTQYYISAGYRKSEGILKPSDYNRYSFKVNVDNQMFKWLSGGTNINLSKSKSSEIVGTDPIHGEGLLLTALSYTTPYTPKYKSNGDFGSNPHQGGWDNPYSGMYGTNASTRISSLLGNVYAKVSILKGLNFKTSLAIDAYYRNHDRFALQEHSEYNRSIGGSASANASQQMIWLNENILDYNFSSGKHAISALAGITRQESKMESSSMQKQGFPDDKVQTLNAGATVINASTNASEWTLQSYLLRMTYAFDNKYLFSANFRTDGSSKFGANNKYGYFPSASVGWRISQEEFFSGISAVNDLKIRASYGLTGNQNGIGEYGHLGLIGLGAVYPFGGTIYPGSYPSTLGNTDLKWESTKQTDIGIDLSLFKSRITFTADVYFKNTSDLLLNVSIPTSTGYSNGIQNIGKIINKGLEFEINTYNLIGEFRWSTDLNFSLNRNEVVDIGGEEKIMYTAGIIRERGNVTIIKEGQPMSMFYGYVSEGVNSETGDIIYKRNSVSSDYMFSPDSDRVIIGDPNPKFIYGITNNFSYKGFSLAIFIQGVYGNDIFNGTRLTLEAMEQVQNQSTATLRRWRNPGDVTDIPRANFGNADNSLVSSRFVEKGTYLRVKSITLSYDFSSDLLKAAHISSLNVFVSAQNLLTFTKYSGYDPEVSWAGNVGSQIDNSVSLGVDYGTYPNVRTFNFGFNVNF